MSIIMISSTSITSTSGVTLISALTPPLAPPRSIAITKSPNGSQGSLGSCEPREPREPREPCEPLLCRLLDEVVDELRRRVVHLDVEVLDARRQVVVDPHGRDRDDQTERGLNERFRNTDRDGAETRRAARTDALERVDDADDRAEKSDERCRGSDGGQRRHALFEVRRGQRRRALDRTANGVHEIFASEAAAALLLELIFLQAGEHDF